jgi:hypothetical protein
MNPPKFRVNWKSSVQNPNFRLWLLKLFRIVSGKRESHARSIEMTSTNSRSLIPAICLAVSCAIPFARAAEPPADLCSLLSADQVSKAFGQPFKAPTKSVAPRPYANTAEGTDCAYSTTHGSELLFRAYVDPSPTAATELHVKLKAFYSPSVPAPGVGDEAYFDRDHAIHVRKGKVRYYLSFRRDPSSEKPLKDLASQVAGRL